MNKVEEAAWNWRRAKASGNDGALGRKMFIQFAVALTAATLVYFFKPCWRHFSYVLYGFSVLFLSGVFCMPIAAGLERAAKALAYGVGQLLTWILLVPFYYLCFMPARLLLAIRGKDPMNRNIERNAETYWVDRPAPSRSDYFEKQF